MEKLITIKKAKKLEEISVKVFEQWRDYYQRNNNKSFPEVLKKTERIIKKII
jgi:hypothetical protein